MRRTLMKSKIHRATVTGADLEYEGSSRSARSLRGGGLLPYERVEIYDCNNGQPAGDLRHPGKDGRGLPQRRRGRLVHRGDLVIIASYAEFEEEEARNHHPSKVFVDGHNRIREL